MKVIAVFLIAGLLGCSMTREVSIREGPDGTYYDLRKAPISFPGSTIRAKDGAEYPAEDIYLDTQRVRWSNSGTPRSIPIDSVDCIMGTNHAIGAVEGFGIGILLGTLAGAIVGAVAASIAEGDDVEAWGYPLMIAGVSGAVAGSVYGGIVGHRYNISFVKQSELSGAP